MSDRNLFRAGDQVWEFSGNSEFSYEIFIAWSRKQTVRA